jgi:[ribosomal protein S18]-alanine N-acetyltransferase
MTGSMQSQTPDLAIQRLESEEEAQACARMMTESEPWITLRRSYEDSLAILRDPTREVYVATLPGAEGGPAGFLILCLMGAFVGYVQTICVHPRLRGRGLGTALLSFAERRIFGKHPNVFMCVSSFNTEAKRLYLHLGYEVVGELRDYIVAGHSEILLRKSIGPLAAQARAPGRQEV